MSIIRVAGVDPGLVHTGVMSYYINPQVRFIACFPEVITGPDAAAVKFAVRRTRSTPLDRIFIEGYRPRSHFDTDARMGQAVNDMRRALPGSIVLNNTGVKQVVRQPLIELLHSWKFNITTHHQDLRSAARIAILGMLKDPELNAILATMVTDHLDGDPWTIK